MVLYFFSFCPFSSPIHSRVMAVYYSLPLPLFSSVVSRSSAFCLRCSRVGCAAASHPATSVLCMFGTLPVKHSAPTRYPRSGILSSSPRGAYRPMSHPLHLPSAHFFLYSVRAWCVGLRPLGLSRLLICPQIFFAGYLRLACWLPPPRLDIPWWIFPFLTFFPFPFAVLRFKSPLLGSFPLPPSCRPDIPGSCARAICGLFVLSSSVFFAFIRGRSHSRRLGPDQLAGVSKFSHLYITLRSVFVSLWVLFLRSLWFFCSVWSCPLLVVLPFLFPRSDRFPLVLAFVPLFAFIFSLLFSPTFCCEHLSLWAGRLASVLTASHLLSLLVLPGLTCLSPFSSAVYFDRACRCSGFLSWPSVLLSLRSFGI